LGLGWDWVGTGLGLGWDWVGTGLGLGWDWVGTGIFYLQTSNPVPTFNFAFLFKNKKIDFSLQLISTKQP